MSLTMLSPHGALAESQKVWRALNGIFCAYKPPGTTMNAMKGTIAGKIAQELNCMEVSARSNITNLQENEGT